MRLPGVSNFIYWLTIVGLVVLIVINSGEFVGDPAADNAGWSVEGDGKRRAPTTPEMSS